MTIFAFDIETVPDLDGLRRLYGLDGLDDASVAEAGFSLRRQETGGSDFLRLHLHRVVVISIAMRSGERFKIWSLGQGDDDEAEVIQRFYDGIERFTPTLVSWNGSGFDLPVLHYRALRHGLSSPRYWETGATEQTFRWNNYLNRFHERHTDLMDMIAGYQPRANAPLDEIATLCGFPGKMGMSGSQVHQAIESGAFDSVRDYCETDALNTYLVWLRFQLLRGHLDRPGYARECAIVRETLAGDGRAHLRQFLDAWPMDSVEQGTDG
ncbi:3'-5' exonuclease [Aquisalimonas sp.]|uniref:3'-5' exonuclease n=1 Tax=Aquisalimonas sp. TaxID=1872621 RepID=UPI0025C41453|nr:3'-5' exonuclease [Aquisalimonas sp.]